MPPLDPHYHVGIVVADLESAQSRLSELLGVRWGRVLQLDDTEYRDGAGRDLTLPTTICYSTGSPALELIQETPGTIWVRNPASNLHHIGFWSDHFVEDSAALSASGCPLQFCGRAGDVAPSQFAYHGEDALGVRIEVVDASLREVMASLFQLGADSA